ncbi:photosynthetic reaction center cytochrome PufC [Lichenifustis flavocetrariae]|uniref:Photosynthetic reaction center cytochrome c subunit n=1 Tax=Lichenifustis flavocetrariae TaxID=2949735 RepID=A0AA42CH77_9HYPH|nr:photosynthetic reaction center cytochrome PufC [Lichenifustis flavocetrariae]MCW6507293.1 photosynthetic reaction center cytochrome PufC [Lichenifustis flavocetrariae]
MKQMKFRLGMALAGVAVVGIGLALTFQRPHADVVQRGFRGTGMDQVFNKQDLAVKAYANQLPAAEPAADLTGVPASQVYQNVKVLGNIDAAELTRLMTAMTTWVAPKQGCAYCHNLNNLASDELYTKVVARRMIQMVWHINSDWKTHVAGTGVTCYTCHRGQPVPAYVWFNNPGPPQALGELGNRAGQNAPTLAPGLASLPYDPFTPFLEQNNDIRVISTSALPDTDHTSIKQTEWTYSLMMHFSNSLGVNCTFCHNTRSFAQWDQSTPQRATAWYGIRMVRDLNQNVLAGLRDVLPAHRWGPLGDGPKVNCATCHQGVYKPLYGGSTLKDYQELASSTSGAVPASPDDAPAPNTPPAAPAPATQPDAPAPKP